MFISIYILSITENLIDSIKDLSRKIDIIDSKFQRPVPPPIPASHSNQDEKQGSNSETDVLFSSVKNIVNYFSEKPETDPNKML